MTLLDELNKKESEKKKNNVAGVLAISAILLYETGKKIDRIVLGKKFRTTKKLILYAAIGSLMLYRCHGEKIDSTINSSKEYVNETLEKKYAFDDLKNQLDQKETLILDFKNYADSISLEKKIKEKEIFVSQRKIDSLTNMLEESQRQNSKTQELTDLLKKELSSELKKEISSLEIIKEEFKTIKKDLENYSKKEEQKKHSQANRKNDNSTKKNMAYNSTNYWHIVKKGETLSSIAKKYYEDQKVYVDIAKNNDIKNPNLIKTGQPIKINNNKLKNTQGLRQDEFPTIYVEANKGEDIFSFTTRVFPGSNADLAKKILEYNQKKGNTIKDYSDLEKHNQIIYIPKKR